MTDQEKDTNMSEEQRFIVRMVGGPFPGDRWLTETQLGSWPPPREMKIRPGDSAERGVYELVSYSKLPESVRRVARGAEYQWKPAE
jgi:hypothetical protein